MVTEGKRSRLQTEKYGTRMAVYFALLTRLRQAVDHPLLLETLMTEVLTKQDVIDLKNKLMSIDETTPADEAIDAWCKTLSPDDFQDDMRSIKYYNHILHFKEIKGTCMKCQDTDDIQILEVNIRVHRANYMLLILLPSIVQAYDLPRLLRSGS
jgi:hypothetical protein